ncbi:MAG: V-type ATPase subunit [Actinomycetota bacterium]|nr:V-type ATPase subunit [Actinomycetota bacterium]
MQAIDFELKDDSYYLFATAELVSREKEFIDDNKLKRLVSSPNVVELSKILRETYYSKYADQLEEGTAFDQVAVQEFKQIASYLHLRLKPEHLHTIDLLLVREQIHNYKAILKALATGTSLEDLFVTIGSSYQQLLSAARTGKGTQSETLQQSMIDKIRQLQQEE